HLVIDQSGSHNDPAAAPGLRKQPQGAVAAGSEPNSPMVAFTNGRRRFFLRTILAGAQQTEPPAHPWVECRNIGARIKTIRRLAGVAARFSRPSTVHTALPASVFSDICRAFSVSVTKKLAWAETDGVQCPRFDARRRCRTPGGWMRSGGRRNRALACSLLPPRWRGFHMGWAAGRMLSWLVVGVGLLTATAAAALDANSIIDTLSGGGNGDGFPASIASTDPDTVSVGPDGSIYIAESKNHRIRRIDPQSGFIDTF